eukprot:CAMPEP_0197049640 /NCGR_PEP_ID=MMETSP1384-20130603/24744_1 /TAXON_ID=29189 /ORGANISM="Ammonia sp." /LENGTH=462 /DNA_ID=CAMNT_0042481945 /DNA_START=229 /DNA_END=1617 /DNA_ORIENTATION=-
MSEDVAGATLMAAGSSAPELFTAIIGVLFYANENPGPSTNCASAAFNMCIIIGCSIFFSGYQGLPIRGYPFIRDCLFYAIAVIELYLFWEVITPGVIQWGESLFLVSSWCGYIVVLANNNKVIKLCVNLMNWMGLTNAEEMLYEQLKCGKHGVSDDDEGEDDETEADYPSSKSYQKDINNDEASDGGDEQNDDHSRHFIAMEMEDVDTEQLNEEIKKKPNKLRVLRNAPQPPDNAASDDNTGNNAAGNATQIQSLRRPPHPAHPAATPSSGSACSKVFHKSLAPFHFLFKYTIPKTTRDSSTPLLSAAFVLVLVWLALLTFICVDAAEKIGNCLGVSEDVMGLTILAIGSSLPDCFSSVLAAKQGKGEMAVSNALGSNVFDICICIGVSFLLKSMISGFKAVLVERDEGFELFIAALFVLLAIFMVAMFCYGLVLNKMIGGGLMAAYAVFLGAFSYLLQYDN